MDEHRTTEETPQLEEDKTTLPETKIPSREPKDDRFKLGKREITLLTIIGLLLIFVGWYGWVLSERKANEANSIDSFDECAAAGNPIMESYPEQCAANGRTFTNPKQQVNKTEETTTMFQIPELEVQFEQSAELAGLYYYISAEKPTIAYFSLNEFKGSECAADKTSLAALSKLSETEIEADEMLNGQKESMQQINDFYYLAAGAQAECSDDEAIQAKSTSTRSSILETIDNTLEAIE